MSCRTEGGFGERVWELIDQTTGAVRDANCTARRFLEVDGPYGFGLTSVAGQERLARPSQRGANPTDWQVQRQENLNYGGLPRVYGEGTYLVEGDARPVPVIASPFSLGMRSIAAYDAQCQPLDLCPAADAARDVALEEERLIYYGHEGDSNALLTIRTWGSGTSPASNSTLLKFGEVFDGLRKALYSLTRRGYAGPFALAAEPVLYGELYSPVSKLEGHSLGSPVLLVDLLRATFRAGIYLAPVIDSQNDRPTPDGKSLGRAGVIVTAGRSYSRLIVGQDWYTAYRGRDGLLHNFLLLSSLQLRICDPRSIEVLRFRPREEDTDLGRALDQLQANEPVDSNDPDVQPLPEPPQQQYPAGQSERGARSVRES